MHTLAEELETSIFASKWFSTIFVYTLPTPLAARVFDAFLLRGPLVLFSVALAILHLAIERDRLLHKSFEELIVYLSNGGFLHFLSEEQPPPPLPHAGDDEPAAAAAAAAAAKAAPTREAGNGGRAPPIEPGGCLLFARAREMGLRYSELQRFEEAFWSSTSGG